MARRAGSFETSALNVLRLIYTPCTLQESTPPKTWQFQYCYSSQCSSLILPWGTVHFNDSMATRGGISCPNLQVSSWKVILVRSFANPPQLQLIKPLFFIEQISTNETRALHNMLRLFMVTTSTPSSLHSKPVPASISVSINQAIHKICLSLPVRSCAPFARGQKAFSLSMLRKG